jgi:hypothetical protein
MRRLVTLTLATAGCLGLLLTPASASSLGRGTQSHPFRKGHYHKIDKHWGVKTVSANYHADKAVADANQFNDKPKSGREYVLVKVAGKCLSGSNQSLDTSEEFKLLGHHTHTLYSESGAVARDDLIEADSVNKGGHQSGNIVFEVKKSDVSRHLLLYVDSPSDFEGHARYFKTS